MSEQSLSEPLSAVEIALETDPQAVIILERNRGWLALVAQLDGRREKRERLLFAEFFARGEPLDQRKLDYERGYFDALDWVTRLPERMRKKLKEEQ